MNLSIDHASHCANIILGELRDDMSVRLSPTVWAFMDADRISGLEIIDTRQFGTPFDEAAALRALAWAREQLDARASA